MVILQQQHDGNPIVDSTVIIGKEEPSTTATKKSTALNQQKHQQQQQNQDETSGNSSDKNNNNLETHEASVDVENIDPDILVKSSSLDPLKSHPKKANPLITGLVTKEKAITTHSNLAGFSKEKEKKLRELYDFLDVNNDGTIDIRDLTAALKKKRYFPSTMAPEIFANMKREDHSTNIDFSDFLNYVMVHEKRLEEVFNQLDKNEDGLVDHREMINYFHNLGIPISDQRARSLVDIMDQSGSSTVDLIEFKDFMILFPSTDLRKIAEFWRHNLVIDIGEDSQIPEDFTPQEMQSGVWWRHLVAGGLAGCMSRTCTAPLDRLKVFLQVHSTFQNRYNLFSALQFLYKEGGIKSFWRGNGINVVKIAPESAFKFMAYEQIKRLIQRIKGSTDLSLGERFIAGSRCSPI